MKGIEFNQGELLESIRQVWQSEGGRDQILRAGERYPAKSWSTKWVKLGKGYLVPPSHRVTQDYMVAMHPHDWAKVSLAIGLGSSQGNDLMAS